MKNEIKRPACLRCKKPMRLLSTGRMVRTFFCDGCKKVEIVNREEK